MVPGNLDRDQFETMTIDELWALYTNVDEVLAERLIALKAEMERRLEQLGQPGPRHANEHLKRAKTARAKTTRGS